jgi:peroxiredoxin
MALNGKSHTQVPGEMSLAQTGGAAVDSSNWVDERLNLLSASESWHPDIRFARSQFRKKVAAHKPDWSRMIGWSAVLVTASLIIAVALTSAPAPRVLAQRCIDCSVAIWQTIAPSTQSVAKLDPVDQRRPAENFELKDANGATVRLSDLKGKVVVLNFWATWCGGCQTEIPWFVEFYNRYKDAGLEIVGVSLDEDGWKSVRPYLAEKPIPYHIALASDAMREKLTTLPLTILIDREGRTALTQLGVPAKATYQADIEALLK